MCCTTTKLTTRKGSPKRPMDGTWETTGRTFYHTSEPIRVFAATFSRLKAQSFPQLSPFLFVWLPLVVLRAAWSSCFFFFCLCICGGCSWLWSPCQLRWLQTFSLEGCHKESALFLCRDLNKTLSFKVSKYIHVQEEQTTNILFVLRPKSRNFTTTIKAYTFITFYTQTFFFFSVPK